MHDYALIVTLASGLSAALVLGYFTQRLGLSPILGYLLAGIVVGPFTPGPVADTKLASQLPEVGVGLHFRLEDLLAVKAIAIPGAIVQSLVATALGTLVAWLAGWGVGPGLVFGIAVSVASTVVLIRGLEDHRALDTPSGHVAVGWLVVEDLFTVLVLVLLPAEGASVLVATSIASISLNPLLFCALGPMEAWLRARPRLWKLLNHRAEVRGRASNVELTARRENEGARAVVVGYGPVGRTLTRILESFEIRPVIVDMNVDTVTRLTAEGKKAFSGDASQPEILKAAGVDRAKYLLVTLPDLAGRLPVIIAAREINAELRIFSRARYLAERGSLAEFGVAGVCYEEAESAVGLSDLLLRAENAPPDRIEAEINRIRAELGANVPI